MSVVIEGDKIDVPSRVSDTAASPATERREYENVDEAGGSDCVCRS